MIKYNGINRNYNIKSRLIFSIFVGIFAINGVAYSQNNFVIKAASPSYSVELNVEKCSDGYCSGNGEIILINKKNKRVFQKFTSDDFTFFLDKNKKPTSNIVELYGEQSPIIFGDFNFDGNDDISIRNGNNSGYGGPSYDIYLYGKKENKFIYNKEITLLAQEYLGMFQVDPKRKRLITFSKSGCCWHQTKEFAVINNCPKETLILTEDAMDPDGIYVNITKETLVNKKWVKTTKKEKIKDYYTDK